MTPNPVRGFFAYPSKPEIAETIRNAASKINDTGFAQLKTWETCRVGGKIIINEICKAIEEAQIFCADLTGLNDNVMFELGFAIARNKRIWITLDQSVVETRADWAKLKLLTVVGYSEYCNSDHLLTRFFEERPWLDLDATIFNQVIRPIITNQHRGTLFYLKSRHATEASTLISREVAKASEAMGIVLIVDDPRETSVQPLAWYAEQAYPAKCVVAHLINPTREGAHLHNAKYSFIAGLAHGLGKPLLMLAQGDTLAPMDYRDLLKNYQTGSEAERHLHSWFVPQIENQKRETSFQQTYLDTVKLAQRLAELKIGEPLAENEAEQLISEYFVETASYREAFDGRQAIFVGRKGAGKSANFIKLAAALESDRRNLVCVIKPLTYEMEGIVELMQRYHGMNLKGYAIESLWKFLLYSEIALTAEAAIQRRQSGAVHEFEKDLIAVLNQDAEMLRQDFSVRLERCIRLLLEKTAEIKEDAIEQNRVAISEILHTGLLRQLREVLGRALEGKERIAILVDNLDKAWDKQSDIDQLAEFLLGLLGTTTRVAADFRNIGFDRRTLNVSLAVFVRADIFYRVINNAREPDKIVYSKMNWHDNEMLLRVIDERFAAALGMPPSDVWNKFFCHAVNNTPTQEYFLGRILKRPRDLLFFVKAAITTAVNRRHGMVEENDIHEAEKQYSQFAIDSILVENGISVKRLENMIYEFVGAPSILTEEEIFALLEGIEGDPDKLKYVVKHLCNLTFLGSEVKQDEFRFADDQADSLKNSVLAQRLLQLRPGPARYKVNPAFWAFLEITA